MEVSKYDSRSALRCYLETLEPRLLLSAVDMDIDADLLATSQDTPPVGYSYDVPVGDTGGAGTTVLLSDVPEYFWYRGCGPTSVAMILGYWDMLGYVNFFSGDASTQTAAVNTGIASAGHDTDWKPTPDAAGPYHDDDCIADFFRTSRDPLPYGWSYLSDADDAFINYGNYVGYSFGHSWNESWSSLSWSDLTGEIDAGRPMMFLVDSSGNGGTDHFIPIIGYRTDPSPQYAAYTTWSNDPGVHWFDWKGMTDGDPWGIAAGTYFHPSSSQPDLAGSGTGVWPPSMTWGDSFSYFYNVDNYGSVAAGGFTIKFYMSSNSYISNSDYELGSLYIASLGAGSDIGGGVSLSLPVTPPSGFTENDDVYIGMIVDVYNDVSEGLGSNNSNLGEGIDYTPVHISGLPDLVGTEFELDLNVMNLGDVKADFTIENIGDSAAGSFVVRFYLSSNSTVSTGDTYLDERTISSLASDGVYSSSITLSPPATDPFGGDGTYTLGMVIDYNNQITEASDSNNSNRGYGLDRAEANYGLKIFNADFETGDGAMEIVNDTAWAAEDGLWHATTTRGTQSGHTGSNSLHYARWDKANSEWDYDIGDSAGVFYTKNIELPNEPAALTFNYWSEVEPSSLYDHISVQVYDADTGSYTTILSKGSGLYYYTGGSWLQATANLADFAGQNVRLRFVFDSIDNSANNHEGWYIDDIAIWAVDNPTTVEAFRSLNNSSDYYHEASYMHWEGDHDTFVFNEEQSNGTFSISSVHGSSLVNPAIAVYDYKTGEMLYMDSDSGTGNEAAIELINNGYWNSYLVEVWDTEEDSIGEVDILIEGSSTIYTSPLSLDGYGYGLTTSLIDTDEDTDYFRVTAPVQASGDLEIIVSELSDTLHARMQVWRGDSDAAPEVISHTENGDEIATFTDVQPGEEFYISVSDHDFSGTGSFSISAQFGLSLPPVLSTAEGYGYFYGPDGIINDTLSFGAYVSVGDIDSYYFAGDSGWTGTYTVTVNRLSGSVDPVVAVYDADTGAQLGFNRDYGDDSTAQLSLTLSSLTKYIVAVTDASGLNNGDVEIIIDTPFVYYGPLVSLDEYGDGSETSQYIGINDTDYYHLIAPDDTDGQLDIVVTPSAALDAAVILFDSSGQELAKSIYAGDGNASTISVTDLIAGEDYYISVLSTYYDTIGTFSLDVNFGQIIPPNNPGGYDYWTVPDLHGDWNGSFSVTGSGDWDGWLFASDVADSSADFSVTGSGGLTPVLALYNADTGQRVAFDANNAQGSTASFSASIAAHQRYYLLSSARDGSSGTASMSMNLPEMSYTTVAMNALGDGSSSGTLTVDEDISYFRFTAPSTSAYGDMDITLSNLDPGLRGSIMLWDDTTGAWITSAAGSANGSDVTLHISNAQAIHVYCLAISSVAYKMGNGSYDLDINLSSRMPGDANLDGMVNLDDFIILKQNYGTGTHWADGEFNGDGVVNLDDFIILKQNYGAVASLAPVDALEVAAHNPVTAVSTGEADEEDSVPTIAGGLNWQAPLADLAPETEVLDILAAM